jgi:S1-C subfamily serine protease
VIQSLTRCLLVVVLCVLVPGPGFAQLAPEMGWLGISISDVSEELADRLASIFGPAAGTGVQIVEVLKDGPADTARLERGDVIVRVDAQPIWDVRQLQRVIRTQPVQGRIVLTVLRGASRVSVPVTVGLMPPAARAQVAGERFGFVVREVGGAGAGGASGPPRLAVAFVDPNSSAARAGLQPQDTIVRVNDQPVSELEGFAQALGRSPERVVLVVERRDAPAPISVILELPR